MEPNSLTHTQTRRDICTESTQQHTVSAWAIEWMKLMIGRCLAARRLCVPLSISWNIIRSVVLIHSLSPNCCLVFVPSNWNELICDLIIIITIIISYHFFNFRILLQKRHLHTHTRHEIASNHFWIGWH